MIYMHKRLKSFEQMVKMQSTSQKVKHVENSYGERESDCGADGNSSP